MSKLETRNWKLEIRKIIALKPVPSSQFPVANQGAVALITSIIVGMLLVAVTTSAIALMSGEIRQATDFDNSIKAYYAAESGAEDAIAEVRRGLAAGQSLASLAKNNCAPYSSSDADLSNDGVVAYTCQVVEVATNQVSASLRTEEATQIDLSNAAAYDRIRLDWNQRGSSDPQNWTTATLPPAFPIGSSWANQYPAVMELTLISYPKTATFDSASISTKSLILKPAAGAGSTIPIGTSSAPVTTNCDSAITTPGSYNCSMSVTGLSSALNYIVRLRTLYSPTNYKVTILNGATAVAIPGAQVSFDVTGKAGDVFRRVLLKVPSTTQPQINFAILADEAICKLITQTGTTAAGPENGCQ